MDEPLFSNVSASLRKAALNEEAKAYILSHPVLYGALKKAALRYIGGETLDEAIGKVKGCNSQGMKCSLEFMGESTRTEKEANAARDEFICICQEIQTQGMYSTVSLDLSHIGLAISKDLCLSNLSMICTEALRGDIEVIISAEGTDRTDAVLAAYCENYKTFKNTSITLQAYLHRTKEDFNEVIKLDGRIRMVKGAFQTAPGLSWPRGNDLDNVYLAYVDQLFSLNHMCSIATHDDKIQQEVKKLIYSRKVDRSLYEFESLFGIQNEQLIKLKDEGYPTKIYFVYGKEWYLYLCNRLAEYPLNVLQAVQDIIS